MLLLQLTVLSATMVTTYSTFGPQYTDFIMPSGEGQLCTHGVSLDWLPDTSLVSCAVACIKHHNCSAFHLYSDVMMCELRQGMCFGSNYFENNVFVKYYQSQSECIVFIYLSFISLYKTHIHTRTRTHTYTHTQTHTHKPTRAHIHTHIHAHTYIYIYIYISRGRERWR